MNFVSGSQKVRLTLLALAAMLSTAMAGSTDALPTASAGASADAVIAPVVMEPVLMEREYPPEPIIRYKGLTDQVTLSYIQSNPGYELQTAPGLQAQASSLAGIAAQWTYRKHYPLDIIGSFRFSHGSLMQQTLETFAGGVGYTHPFRRFALVGQGLAGISLTNSQQQMYLYSGTRKGFTTIIGGGVEVKLHKGWGVRPIYSEYQYLPFGQIHSKYWNFSPGVFYRFHQQRSR
jgi:hypothetical protein